MELLEALRLQWEWGADEALLDAPQDRRHAAPPPEAVPEPPRPRPAAVAKLVSALPAGPAEARQLAESCHTLAALEAAMRGFTGCALRDTATQLVFADGADDARLIIVGEAPGAEEDRAGKPFVGPAGQLLDRMLASIGLDRTQVRIINTVPWRPPGNRTPSEAEIALCLPFLHRQIALVAPRGLLALGAVAAKALLPAEGGLGIRRLRGTWREAQIAGLPAALPCLATYHPAYLLRTPAAKAEAWRDLLSVKAWLETLPAH
ncbi:uracil-DNA glycosylase family protein [Acidocella sp. KAb 2-4]|uniref:uracil-DNA glycosylase n=1 Tax=Acidocella sp. KAb 2-4 TaxID=2885158 RepID=UPI001D06AF46|nr:uracil-DNA glycosylase [Acidocella sp. KAb 2-4]MCB5943328.1 uracil-DNA glycosylase [Acidocella sp. KAb 2-4]